MWSSFGPSPHRTPIASAGLPHGQPRSTEPWKTSGSTHQPGVGRGGGSWQRRSEGREREARLRLLEGAPVILSWTVGILSTRSTVSDVHAFCRVPLITETFQPGFPTFSECSKPLSSFPATSLCWDSTSIHSYTLRTTGGPCRNVPCHVLLWLAKAESTTAMKKRTTFVYPELSLHQDSRRILCFHSVT